MEIITQISDPDPILNLGPGPTTLRQILSEPGIRFGSTTLFGIIGYLALK
jgi:hypothetical protein